MNDHLSRWKPILAGFDMAALAAGLAIGLTTSSATISAPSAAAGTGDLVVPTGFTTEKAAGR